MFKFYLKNVLLLFVLKLIIKKSVIINIKLYETICCDKFFSYITQPSAHISYYNWSFKNELVCPILILLKLYVFLGALRTKGPVVQYTSENSASASSRPVAPQIPPARPVAAGPPQPSRTE